jgi:hypothetical protein
MACLAIAAVGLQPLLRFHDPALNKPATDPLSLAEYDALTGAAGALQTAQALHACKGV